MRMWNGFFVDGKVILAFEDEEPSEEVMAKFDCGLLRIDKEMAGKLLATNEWNRKLKIPSVNRYAADFKSGNWQTMNGEALCISKYGYEVNGFHRLTAIIKADAVVILPVFRGTEGSVYDRGTSRTTLDSLTFEHCDSELVRQPNVSVVNNVYKIKKARSARPSDAEVREFLEKYKTVFITLNKYQKQNTENAITTTKQPFLTALFFALCCSVPEDLIRDFVQIYRYGYSKDGGVKKEQVAALALRDCVTRYGFIKKSYEKENIEGTFKIETAISDFCNGITKKKRYDKLDCGPAYSGRLTFEI